MTTIGFIGLGHMGHPMAMNCLKHYPVIVYDVQTASIASLALEGAIAANSISDIAVKADVIFTMLQNGEQVQDVFTRKDGLLSHAKKNTLFIDCSSIDIQTARDLHQITHTQGFAFLDAPVSGGVAGALAGTLTLMVGGDPHHLQRAEPYLQCVGKNIIHAGPGGNGQVAKICNNMLLAISMIGVSEAFILGEKLGLDPKTFFAISSKSSGQCWSMTSYSPVPGLVETAPSNRAYQPGFTSKMMLKDLLLSRDAATLAAVTTPLGEKATDLYQALVNAGLGDLDFSAMIRYLTEN